MFHKYRPLHKIIDCPSQTLMCLNNVSHSTVQYNILYLTEQIQRKSLLLTSETYRSVQCSRA